MTPHHETGGHHWRAMRGAAWLCLFLAFHDHPATAWHTGFHVGAGMRLRDVHGLRPSWVPPLLQRPSTLSRTVLSERPHHHHEGVSSGITTDDDDEAVVLDETATADGELGALTAVVLLNIVAVIWGSQHAVIKSVLMDQESFVTTSAGFTLARFSLAMLTVASFTPDVRALFFRNDDNNDNNDDDDRRSPDDREAAVKAWRWGAEMGGWMFLGYAFQAIGLAYTTAQRSGFLLYLNVKFVPFFAYVLLGRQISIPTWISALVALSGTALLSYDPTTPLNVGDAWSIAAAMASAMFILRMERATEQVKDSAGLNAATLWTVTVLALVWTVGEGGLVSTRQLQALGDSGSSGAYDAGAVVAHVLRDAVAYPVHSVVQTVRTHPIGVLYLGVISTALANYVQTKAQRGISAERASIIYAMDPVYGAVFANLILGETLGTQGMVGAGLIALAAATNAFLDFGTQDTDDGELGTSSSKGEILAVATQLKEPLLPDRTVNMNTNSSAIM